MMCDCLHYKVCKYDRVRGYGLFCDSEHCLHYLPNRLEKVKQASDESKWIPANEPPKEEGEYFVHRKGYAANHRAVLWYSKKRGWHYTDPDLGNVTVKNVTHWMPLPEAPKEGE